MKVIFRFILSLCILFIFNKSSYSEIKNSKNNFELANKEYSLGNYNKALELYEKIDIKSSSLYYNMGNVYYKNNQKTKALAFYLKAKKLSPYDSKIREKINLINKEIDYNTSYFNSSFIWNDFFTLEEIIVFSIFMWIIFWFVFILKKYKSIKNNYLDYIVLSFICINIFTILSLISKLSDENYQKGIIITKSADIKTSFDNSGISLSKLPEGSFVLVYEKSSNFVKIKNPDGVSGWVRNSSIVVIE